MQLMELSLDEPTEMRSVMSLVCLSAERMVMLKAMQLG